MRLYSCLPHADRVELQWLVQVFLDEKFFEGCLGLVLTDEIKLTVARLRRACWYSTATRTSTPS